MLSTPVAIIVFNRPDTTLRVFSEIAKAKPRKLFVAADGPRPDRPGEAEKCTAARAVTEAVDWDCEVLRSYAEVNLGCGLRPASALGWVFEHVEEAIILEDDCLPHPSFFRFCHELLERYRDDQRVMMVSGNQWHRSAGRTPHSYHFSLYPGTWGWASWRRSWQHYDFRIKLWPALRNTSWLQDTLGEARLAEAWTSTFDRLHASEGNTDTWDYQWVFACWAQNGLAVTPRVNLVSNIGFRHDATHTSDPTSAFANAPTAAMEFPLQHPPFLVRNGDADRLTSELFFPPPRALPFRVARSLYRAVPEDARELARHLRSRLQLYRGRGGR
jgi:hypothetical protein